MISLNEFEMDFEIFLYVMRENTFLSIMSLKWHVWSSYLLTFAVNSVHVPMEVTMITM